MLELSVVLAIIAVIVAGTLSMGSSMISSAKLVNTYNKLDAIEKALMAYRIANNRLPCPSDPTLTDIPVTPATYGYEAGTPGTCTYTNGAYTMPHYTIPSQSNNGTAPYTPTTTNLAALGMSVVEGAVPVKTLGLPDEFQFDGWGRKIAYAVAAQMTAKATTTADSRIAAAAFVSYGAAANCGAITVQNGGGNNRTQVADYVLLSYGPDGHGGYLKSGAQSFMGSDNSGEQANCHCTATAANNASYTATYIQEDPFQTTSTDALSAFDDIVRYKERWQMQNDYDKYHPGSQLPCTQGFQVQATSALEIGYSVATGDVNGDGIPDLVIGGIFANSSKGAVYVIFGTHTGFPDPLPLPTALNGTNGFELDGDNSSDQIGQSVTTGDVNGDGISDIIISGVQGISTSNYTYVVFGGKGPSGTWANTPYTLNLGGSIINGTQGVRFAQGSDSVTTGDVNGDGIADLIINSIVTLTNNGSSGWGSVFIVFGNGGIGGSTGNVAVNVGNGNLIDGIHGIRFDEMAGGLALGGYSMATGDVNGDGIADIVTGVVSGSGGTYVIFGKNTQNTTFLPSTTITTASMSATATVGSYGGLQVGQYLMSSTIPAGTYISACSAASNGACQSTSITLSSGTGVAPGTNTPVTVAETPINNIGHGTLINGTTGVRFDAAASGDSDYAGFPVATGDINGDGIADVIIGAWGPSYTGYTYVVFGKRTNWTAPAGNIVLNTGYGNMIDGVQGVRFDSVSLPLSLTTGDINGDGIPDVVIGEDHAIYYSQADGYTYAIFGNSAILPSTTITTSAGSANATVGSYTNLQVGQTLSASTIPAGTTISTCIAGANGACGSTSITLSSGTGVTSGTNTPVTVATTPLNIGTGTLINGTTGARFDGALSTDLAGFSVATGDINGDGVPDLIIGARGINSYAGGVYIYNGRASGWPNPNNYSGAGYPLGGL